jgi:aspartyl-tRNA(Asn)/glutamyl-tRNA(Gln) amidotransferase subunit A
MKTIQQIHDAFDQKQISVVELTREYLAAAKKSHHNAFITLCEERALKQAQAADAEIARVGRVPRAEKPLLGIPLGIKDNLVVDGVRTTCASKMLEHYVFPSAR